MNKLTAVLSYYHGDFFEKTISFLTKSPIVEKIFITAGEEINLKIPKSHTLLGEPLTSQKTIDRILSEVETELILIILKDIYIEQNALDKIVKTSELKNAGLVYSDFYEEGNGERILHPLNDYQTGSVRDDFDFGPVLLLSLPSVRNALKKYGPIPEVKFSALYDLRLKLSVDHPIYHLREPMYSIVKKNSPSAVERIFSYLDSKNQPIQREMEMVFTNHLKNIGAYINPQRLKKTSEETKRFPLEASIIIPVRNRKETIGEAIKSALSQETNFPFNIIIVDNHSTDGTTSIISNLSNKSSKLKHIIPKRTDLGIGGCWNEAINSKYCGRYAIQLDSDDLYSSKYTLQKMVDMLREENFAMVIGSYTVVNYYLREIPPGFITHEEWSDENGHNNALRINGLGAPRGFDTSLIRKIGFLNESYGEDYAMGLRISREYRIGRIYENLYLSRRWSGNSDEGLSIEEINQRDAFKDKIRTDEILFRQKINREFTLSPSPP